MKTETPQTGNVPAVVQPPLVQRLFQAEWWAENIQRTGWRKEQGAPRTIAEMRSWLEYHRFRMLRVLPEMPIQGVVEITHVENGRITDEQAEYLGGYWVENISGTIALASAVSSLNAAMDLPGDPSGLKTNSDVAAG